MLIFTGKCFVDGFISSSHDLGYHGLYCEEEYNECLSAPCQNGATCRDLVNSYECACLAEYEGKMLFASCSLNCSLFLIIGSATNRYKISSIEQKENLHVKLTETNSNVDPDPIVFIQVSHSDAADLLQMYVLVMRTNSLSVLLRYYFSSPSPSSFFYLYFF